MKTVIFNYSVDSFKLDHFIKGKKKNELINRIKLNLTISQTLPLWKQEAGHRGINQKKRDDNKRDSRNIFPAFLPHTVFK